MPLWLFGFTLERLCAKTRLNQPEASVRRWQLASRERCTSCWAATSTGCSLSVCPCSRARITTQWQTQHSLGCRDELPSVHADEKTPKKPTFVVDRQGELLLIVTLWSVTGKEILEKCMTVESSVGSTTEFIPNTIPSDTTKVVLLVPSFFVFFFTKAEFFLLEGNIEN